MIKLIKKILFKYYRKNLHQLKGEIYDTYAPYLKKIESDSFSQQEIDFISNSITDKNIDAFKIVSDYFDFITNQNNIDIRNIRINILYLNRYDLCFYSSKEINSLFVFIEDFEFEIQSKIQDRLRKLYLDRIENNLDYNNFIVSSYPYGGIPDA